MRNLSNNNYIASANKSALGLSIFDGVLPTVWKIVVCGSVVGVFAVLAFYGMEMLSARPIKKLFNRA